MGHPLLQKIRKILLGAEKIPHARENHDERGRGFYKGRHFSEYPDQVRSLKRAGRLEEAERLLLNLIEATEAESRAEASGVAPSYYEQLAIVYRKQKKKAREQEILERFARQRYSPGVMPAKLLQRLQAITGETELLRKARQRLRARPGGTGKGS